MSSGWRLARSLDVLRAEIWQVAPGTTVWTIGDARHRATASDHNPNRAGVVCAVDVLGNGGLDLDAFAEHLRKRRHPALKYVIYQDRIASAGGPWRPYRGQYHTHVHVSVGVGPDGQSTGPYDNTSPWGLAAIGGDMQPTDNLPVKDWLAKAYPNDKDLHDGITVQTALVSGYGFARLAADRAAALEREVTALRKEVAALRAGAGATPELDYDRLAEALLRRIARG